mmetsp:Transcript_24414/g.37638  ORF Transcript_24414/g.37638 Transcript_24414/m.37638 type:complete len:206 (+) Transcript_24414:291-908(+)
MVLPNWCTNHLVSVGARNLNDSRDQVLRIIRHAADIEFLLDSLSIIRNCCNQRIRTRSRVCCCDGDLSSVSARKASGIPGFCVSIGDQFVTGCACGCDGDVIHRNIDTTRNSIHPKRECISICNGRNCTEISKQCVPLTRQKGRNRDIIRHPSRSSVGSWDQTDGWALGFYCGSRWIAFNRRSIHKKLILQRNEVSRSIYESARI